MPQLLDHPIRLLVIGFLLLLVGTIVPFLMMLRVIESTFFLNFLSYACTVVGLMLGVIGSALFVKKSRKG